MLCFFLNGNRICIIDFLLSLHFFVGQTIQRWTRDWITQRKNCIVWVDPIVIGIAVYVAMSGAVSQGLFQLLSLDAMMIGGTYAPALFADGILGYRREDRIAFLFAGPQKSVAIGAPLAAILFKPAVAGFIIAPLIIYHLMQLAVAVPIATRLARSRREQP